MMAWVEMTGNILNLWLAVDIASFSDSSVLFALSDGVCSFCFSNRICCMELEILIEVAVFFFYFPCCFCCYSMNSVMSVP